MDVNRLAKSPNEDLSDDEAKGSGNANDSIKIRPITYKDVQSATEKIYNGGINKTNLQVSPTRGVNQRNIRTHPQHTFLKPRRSNLLHCQLLLDYYFPFCNLQGRTVSLSST